MTATLTTPQRAPRRDDTPRARPELSLEIEQEPLPFTAVPLDTMIQRAKEGKPGATPADELRHKMVEMFKGASGVLSSFYDYSRQAAALAEEYHAARFSEKYPSLEVGAFTLACTLDSRETPASLDKKLAELEGVVIRKIIFDQARATYYLFI